VKNARYRMLFVAVFVLAVLLIATPMMASQLITDQFLGFVLIGMAMIFTIYAFSPQTAKTVISAITKIVTAPFKGSRR
jgi:hypothetical protein